MKCLFNDIWSVTLTFDLLTLRSNHFISVPTCTYVINLVKLPQAVCKISYIHNLWYIIITHRRMQEQHEKHNAFSSWSRRNNGNVTAVLGPSGWCSSSSLSASKIRVFSRRPNMCTDNLLSRRADGTLCFYDCLLDVCTLDSWLRSVDAHCNHGGLTRFLQWAAEFL